MRIYMELHGLCHLNDEYDQPDDKPECDDAKDYEREGNKDLHPMISLVVFMTSTTLSNDTR